MKSIVVPINFSPCAANAARYAADLALAIKADLHLIHVMQVPITSIEMVMTEYLYQEMVDTANSSLKELQVELSRRTRQKIKVDTALEAGSIGDKVKDLCERVKPYAVVLGAAGPTMERFLIGSPIAALLHTLRFPVLVIPENAVFHHFRRILLACDLEDIGSGIHGSLPLLKDLREHFGSRFDVITVETSKVVVDEQKVFEGDAWKDPLKDLYPEVHYIRTPNVEEGILEYLKRHDADLVMVFPKKHGFFDFHISQSRKLARHSPIPVLSLHAGNEH